MNAVPTTPAGYTCPGFSQEVLKYWQRTVGECCSGLGGRAAVMPPASYDGHKPFDFNGFEADHNAEVSHHLLPPPYHHPPPPPPHHHTGVSDPQ